MNITSLPSLNESSAKVTCDRVIKDTTTVTSDNGRLTVKQMTR